MAAIRAKNLDGKGKKEQSKIMSVQSNLTREGREPKLLARSWLNDMDNGTIVVLALRVSKTLLVRGRNLIPLDKNVPSSYLLIRRMLSASTP